MKFVPPPFQHITRRVIHLSEPTLRSPHDPFRLGDGNRAYQIECFETFADKNRTLLISSTGSGKSLVQIACAIRRVIASDYAQKQIFVIPQRNIARSFFVNRPVRIIIDGIEYIWDIGINCCEEEISERSIAKVKKFLFSTPNCDADRHDKIVGNSVAIACYPSFVAAFNQLSHEEKVFAIKTTAFCIDEAHHIMGADLAVEYGANSLGRLCKEILSFEGSNLHLTTATFFRGDDKVILGNESGTFTQYRVPFLRHWESLGLEEFIQDYVSYDNAADAKRILLNAIQKESDQPSLIYLPRDGHGIFRFADKTEFVRNLVSELEDLLGKDTVLDLISPLRKTDENRLMSEEQDFKAIVACYKVREGTDWPALSRIHNLVNDGNVLQPVQKMGRALRKYPGKTNVKMTNYIPSFPEWDKNPDKIREVMSDRFNAVAFASLRDDMFYPIVMPGFPKGQRSSGGSHRGYTLEDIYGDLRQNVIDDLIRAVEGIPDKDLSPSVLDNEIKEIIDAYRDDMLVDVDDDILIGRLRKEVVRYRNPENPALKQDAALIDFIRENGWDKVFRLHVANKSPFIGAATTDDLRRLQELVAGVSDTEFRRKVDLVKDMTIDEALQNTELRRFLFAQKIAWNKAKNRK